MRVQIQFLPINQQTLSLQFPEARDPIIIHGQVPAMGQAQIAATLFQTKAHIPQQSQ